MALTDVEIKTAIKTAKATGKASKLPDGKGLHLEAPPTGNARWRLRYRFAGKENVLSMGVYPATSLKAARAGAEATRKQLANGIDPSQERKIAKLTAAASSDNTFEAVAREWYEVKHGAWSGSYAKSIMERLEKNVFPWAGRRPIDALKAPELLMLLRRVEARGAIDTAHRCQQIIKNVFSYAVSIGKAERNPATDLTGTLKTVHKGHHAAVVDPVKLGQLLRDIDHYTGSYLTRACLQLHALLFLRPGELRAAEWAEFDLDAATWQIPQGRMKNSVAKKADRLNLPHYVPLAPQAVAILRELHPLTGSGALVFPSERKGGRCMSEATARAAIRAMGYSNDDHTPHGFRATARTLLRQELGFDKDVIERQLAHKSSEELGDAYDRAQFKDQRKAMMTAWADYLDKLKTGARVIQFKAA